VHNHSMALVYELIRKGAKDLTIVGLVSAGDVDILIGAGCVKRVETAYLGLEEFGPAPNFRRSVERGEIEIAEYSEPVAFERFQCSARGQPFFTTLEMLGTACPPPKCGIIRKHLCGSSPGAVHPARLPAASAGSRR